MYQPKTGVPCTCKRGVQRDNCPECEGTGQRIDFAAVRARGSASRPPEPAGRARGDAIIMGILKDGTPEPEFYQVYIDLGNGPLIEEE